jgi:hypothetical protein
MGSFEVYCNGTLLYSKLSQGYFPQVTGLVTKIASFIDDSKNGRDLKKYAEGKGKTNSTHKSHGKTSGLQRESPGNRVRYNPDEGKRESRLRKEERKEDRREDRKEEGRRLEDRRVEDHHKSDRKLHKSYK